MEKWKRHLETYSSFLKKLSETRKGNLRFGRGVIAASDIAEQCFCEKKVEMQYVYREIETEAKIVGATAHENLLEDAIRVKRVLFSLRGLTGEFSLRGFTHSIFWANAVARNYLS